jgi:hypothetical protein
MDMDKTTRDFLEAIQVALDCPPNLIHDRAVYVHTAVSRALEEPRSVENMTGWLRKRIGGEPPSE